MLEQASISALGSRQERVAEILVEGIRRVLVNRSMQDATGSATAGKPPQLHRGRAS